MIHHTFSCWSCHTKYKNLNIVVQYLQVINLSQPAQGKCNILLIFFYRFTWMIKLEKFNHFFLSIPSIYRKQVESPNLLTQKYTHILAKLSAHRIFKYWSTLNQFHMQNWLALWTNLFCTAVRVGPKNKRSGIFKLMGRCLNWHWDKTFDILQSSNG